MRLPAKVCVVSALLLGPTPTSAQIREDLSQEAEQLKRRPKLTKPPRLLHFVEAKYPPQAQRRGKSGKVRMHLSIGLDGTVKTVKVVGSAGPLLDAAAAAAAAQFRFSPAEVDGKPAAVRIRYTYNFVLRRSFRPRTPSWLADRQQHATGQDVIVGQIREEGTRLPIPGAAVAIAKHGLEVKADGQGRFSVLDLPAGKVTLRALSLEHKAETINVEIREGEQSKVTFYLPRMRENTYETVVRGRRRQTTVTRVTLRGKQLTTVPGTFGDPVRVIENLPGLARVPYVGGALLVRGAAPGDSGVYLDGNRIPIIYHFLGGPSVLNPQFLDRIDYYPGNADARYGRLIAGVVDVSTQNTFGEQFRGSLDVNLLNSSVFLKVPVAGRVSVSGAVRRSYIDAILPAVLDAAGQEATTVVPVYYDYQLRVDVKLDNPADRLFVLAFGSDDDLEVVSNEVDRDVNVNLNTKIAFHRVLAQWQKQFGSRFSSRIQPVFGFNLVNIDSGNAGVDIRTMVLGLRHDMNWRIAKRLTLRFGADIEGRRSNFSATIPVPADYRVPGTPDTLGAQGGVGNQLTAGTEAVDVVQWLGGIGAYVDAILRPTRRLQLIPGLRAGLILYFGNARPVLDPRLTVRYRLRPDTVLKGAAGLFSQAPPPNEANDTFGNPDLQLEHAAHFSLGVEHKFTRVINIDAQIYAIQRFDLSVETNRVRFGADGQPERLFYVNDGVATSFGLELLLKHEVTRNFYGWLAYTLSRSTERTEEDEDPVRFLFDQTHLLTVVASYRFGSGWEAGMRFRLASGRPETPVLNGIYDSDADGYLQRLGQARSTSRQLFHQLDLRLEKTWFFRRWRLAAYIDVQNVYNAENPEATVFDYRFRESGPLRGLPVLPTLGIKGSF